MPKAAKVPKVRFNLKNYSDRDSLHQIIAVYRYGPKLVYYTGLKVKPKWWNTKANKAKESVNFTDGVSINEELSAIETHIKAIYNENKEIPLDQFRNEVDYRRGLKERPKKQNENKTLFEFIESYIEKKKKNAPKRHGQTWQRLKTVFNLLKTYSSEIHGKELDYNDITLDLKDNFAQWCRDTYTHSETYISANIAKTKQFMLESRDYHSNTV